MSEHAETRSAHSSRAGKVALDPERILAAATDEVPRLRSGPNPPAFLAELDAAFERAAQAALADPALAERSRRLRSLGRRLVPEPLRPAARRLAAQADDAARRYPALLRIGRELAELVDGVAREALALEEPARQLAQRAEAAARKNPALLQTLRNANAMLERSARSDQLPSPLRRAARVALSAAARLRGAGR